MKSIEWLGDKVRILDQTQLPLEETYIETTDYRVVAEAIKRLSIRGAPAIGIAAAFGYAMGAKEFSGSDSGSLAKHLEEVERLLSSTRPTAGNLFWALKRMRRIVEANGSLSLDKIQNRLIEEAKKILIEDIETCKQIGRHGANLVPQNAGILTHCNTGALATGDHGTAQSVIVSAHEMGKKVRVYVDETRPLLQGARLTTWELMKRGVETVLITDNAAAFVMKKGLIDFIVVGADRIARNGDVANKIGTYNVAVLAEKHRIPFYVAAPISTIDFGLESGADIPIEERDPAEVTEGFGKRTAPQGVRVYSPAFDITPNQLVTGIITENGVSTPPYDRSIPKLQSSGRD